MLKNIFICILALTLLGCVSPGPQTFGKDFQNNQFSNGTEISKIEEAYGPPQRKETVKSPSGQQEIVYYYFYQGPIPGGKFISKELILVFLDSKVVRHNYNEKIILKLEKDSKFSNNIIQLD